MIDQGEVECRPFFTCESCGLVYARLEEPQLCLLCEAPLFTIVLPERVER